MKIRVFVDGACSENPGPGGWAVVFNTDMKCKVIKGYEENTTNNRMELTAVVKAMEKIYKSDNKKNTYEIFSDSAYVVNSINGGWVEVWDGNGWKTTRHEDIKNKDLWSRYLKLRKTLDDLGVVINIIKIKGHSGNVFNEYVDKLAKEEAVKVKRQRGGRYA